VSQSIDEAPCAVTLVVDVANAVGSRPDGWWHDRRGATEHLLVAVARLQGRRVTGPTTQSWLVDRVVAVVEGAARDATAPAAVHVVRAAGSGDDALVEHLTAAPSAENVVVVTADRGLRARLPDGVTTVGPGWLRTLLGTAAPPP
jgi:hypothetical protein